MGRFGKKEPKLNEVKAVLQRLQGFPEDEKPAPPQSASDGTRPPRGSRGGLVVGAIIIVQAAAIVGAAYLFSNLMTPEPDKVMEGNQAVRSEAVKAALQVARGLMSKGQVRSAREQLLALAWKGSPDAAWDLARSYDPNVLSTLPQADAAPDIAEATRWYRTWYDAAVKEGMVTNSVSIERIISSMERSVQRAP